MKKIALESMSSDLITIGWNEPVETAWHRMSECHVRHLPVHNERGEVVGMLSDRDVQRAMISIVEGGHHLGPSSETIQFDPDSRVKDYMSWPVKTIDYRSDLKLVIEEMLTQKLSSLLVREEAQIIGIVTTEDLMRVLMDLLSDPKSPAHWNLAKTLELGSRKLEATLI